MSPVNYIRKGLIALMEEEKNSEMEIGLRDFGAVFVHCWWIMLLAAVVVGVALYLFLNATHKDEYTAEASIYVMRSTGDGEGDGTTSQDISIATYLVRDAPELILSHQVLDRVIIQQNRILSYEQLKEMITITNEENTRILYLSVTAADPVEAASLVTSLANVTCDFMNNDMYDGQKLFKVVDQNVVPDQPSNPISMLKILLVAFACAIVVYAVYLVMFLMDDKINTPEDVERYLGLNLLGQIPNKKDTGRGKRYYAQYSSGQ